MKKFLNKIFGHHFHTWVMLDKEYITNFEGEDIKLFRRSHRYCPECRMVQEYHNYMGDQWWTTYRDEIAEVFLKHRGL